METNLTPPPSPPAPENNLGYWRRVLRPLFWWLLLVVGLFGIHQHQLAMEQTRIKFSVTLQGKDVRFFTTVKLDDQPVVSGQKISLGNHKLSVVHPKAEPFTTNFFSWYGGQDFGAINLQRAFGSLNVTANPPAPLLTITGPEFFLALHDRGGTNLTVPTDAYEIQAHYPHWSQTQTPTVFDRQSAAAIFSPQFGALHLTCNREEAAYELRTANGQYILSGNLPATVIDLPSDIYQAIITFHNRPLQKNFFLKAFVTNEVPVEFLMGTARVESEPAGAMVQDADGRNLGQTPLDLLDMPAQTTQLKLSLRGYQSALVTLDIAADQTTTNRTRLISDNYFAAMDTARRSLAAADYEQALSAVQQALEANPGDAAALALQREGGGRLRIQMAKLKGAKGNYIGAIQNLEPAIHMLSDNEEAKALLAEYRPHVPEQLVREKAERLKRPRAAFDLVLQSYPEASLFESHALKSALPWKKVSEALARAFQGGQPEFMLMAADSGQPEVFHLEANQKFMTYLQTVGGLRRVVIVGGQATDDETQIYFMVLEYKSEAVNKFSIGNLIGTPVAVNYVPIHASKMTMTEALNTRLAEGVQLVNDRIKKAIGQP